MQELSEKVIELRKLIAELVEQNRLKLSDAMTLFGKIEEILEPVVRRLDDGLQASK